LVINKKNWIRDLGLEAESDITLLPPEEQDYTRYQSGKTIKKTPNPTNLKK